LNFEENFSILISPPAPRFKPFVLKTRQAEIFSIEFFAENNESKGFYHADYEFGSNYYLIFSLHKILYILILKLRDENDS